MNKMKLIITSLFLLVGLQTFSQVSGGQIRRKTNTAKVNRQTPRKQFAPNEVVDVENGKIMNFETTQTVDLGLPSRTMWAGWNIGANSPKEEGEYYAWGETEPKSEYDWNNYFDIEQITPTIEFKKYHVNGILSIVRTERDIALKKWGKPWKMPTKDQLEELINYSSMHRVKFPNESKMYILITGPNGKSILFPLAGEKYKGETRTTFGELCWSGELRPYYSASPQNSQFAFCLEANYPAGLRLSVGFRLYGMNVRAVTQ